jgi:predicted transcriptional regulator of viral defense system
MSRQYLERLKMIGRGLHAIPGVEVGFHHSLAVAARRVPHAVICLLNALRFRELTTQAPHEVWIAIGPKDRQPVKRVAAHGATSSRHEAQFHFPTKSSGFSEAGDGERRS